jgi:hypothetical protein
VTTTAKENPEILMEEEPVEQFRRELHERLNMLRKAYEREAAPIIKMLIEVEGLRTPPPFLMSVEDYNKAMSKIAFALPEAK